MARDLRTSQHGFTLLELLIVIAVLAMLAGAAILGVGALRDRSQEVACDSDARTLDTAEQAMVLATGSAGDEEELVGAGYIDRASEYHDIVTAGDAYELVGVGPCAPDLNNGGPVEIAGPADPAQPAESTQTRKSTQPTSDAGNRRSLEPGSENAKARESEPTKPKDPAARCAKDQVDINSAGPEELDRIKHIGQSRAREIIALRPFRDLRDLERVKGLGPSRVSDIIEQNTACG